MNNLLLSSEGVGLEGQQWLPPLRLHAGESLCLHVNGPACGKEEQRLLGLLTGIEQSPGLRVFGRVEFARTATGRTGFLGRFVQPYPVDWLLRAGVSPRDAGQVVARLGLKPEWRVCNLPATPRTLLGLEAVWARGAEAVVFSCAGLDPLGRRAVFEVIRAHLETCAAIYLSYPYGTQGWHERDHLPGATCLDATNPASGSSLSLPA